MVHPNTLSNDLANWIGNLPDELKDISVINLAIPGTHDSMTYNMTSSSEVAPDADSFLIRSNWLSPFVKSFAVKWSITQYVNVTNQLEHGIRYLDLRLATKTNTKNLYFCHGYYCGLVTAEFDKINNFLTDHPKEVVILDFQHFYAFDSNDHMRLIQDIENIFGNKVLKNPKDYNSVTLNYLHMNSLQVICIYRNAAGNSIFWPGSQWPTPWPETTSSRNLFTKLNNGLKNRNMGKGYVSQCVLTPDGGFIFQNIFSNLKNACGNKIQKSVIDWIKKQKPGDGKFNVSIKDFADLENWSYPKTVIDLNLKLLE